MQSITKKGLFYQYAVVFVLGIVAWPVQAWAGAVEMVTYFPTPYVRYNSLYDLTKLDIGSTFGKFELVVGKDGFYTPELNLNSGALRISEDVTTTTASFGKVAPVTVPTQEATFHDLYLGSVTDSTTNTPKPLVTLVMGSNAISQLTATGRSQLNVFDNKTLPSCIGA